MAMASQKKPSKRNLASIIKTKWWAILLLLVFVFAVGTFAYNKYLDYRNVQDMKSLLADFEQLKTDVEAETGEATSIGMSCGTINEKFLKTPSCYVFLLGNQNTQITSVGSNLSQELIDNNSCNVKGEIGFKFSNSNEVIFSCYPLILRPSSTESIQDLSKNYM